MSLTCRHYEIYSSSLHRIEFIQTEPAALHPISLLPPSFNSHHRRSTAISMRIEPAFSISSLPSSSPPELEIANFSKGHFVEIGAAQGSRTKGIRFRHFLHRFCRFPFPFPILCNFVFTVLRLLGIFVVMLRLLFSLISAVRLWRLLSSKCVELSCLRLSGGGLYQVISGAVSVSFGCRWSVLARSYCFLGRGAKVHEGTNDCVQVFTFRNRR